MRLEEFTQNTHGYTLLIYDLINNAHVIFNLSIDRVV